MVVATFHMLCGVIESIPTTSCVGNMNPVSQLCGPQHQPAEPLAGFKSLNGFYRF
jgi:hypothetical protein